MATDLRRKDQYRIRIERNAAIDGEWCVTEYRNNRPQTVMFRGDLAEAHDYAQDFAHHNAITSELDD